MRVFSRFLAYGHRQASKKAVVSANGGEALRVLVKIGDFDIRLLHKNKEIRKTAT